METGKTLIENPGTASSQHLVAHQLVEFPRETKTETLQTRFRVEIPGSIIF